MDGESPAPVSTSASGPAVASATTPVDGDESGVDDGEDATRRVDADDPLAPFVEHSEELVTRLAIVAAVGFVATVLAIPSADAAIMFVWNEVLPGRAGPPHVYTPLELVFAELKFAGLVGFVVVIPALVLQLYLFVRPGLYPHERRYYLAAVPTSLVLALLGVAFAYYAVVPLLFAYFVGYSAAAGTTAFALGGTIDLVVVLLAYMAMVFQLPLLVMFAVLLGLTTREWLADKRLLVWAAFLGISFLLGPDPTGMVPIVVTLTMGALFEGTLVLLRWTGH